MLSPAVLGLETSTVEVEVDLRAGLPAFSVVGLPDAAVQEARERVRSGARQPGLRRSGPPDRGQPGARRPPQGRPQYDLPLALATLAASGQMAPAALAGVGAVGELALDGSLRPVAGALAMAEHAVRAGWRRLVVPRGNAAEAGLVPGLDVLGAGRPSAPPSTCWRAASRATCRAWTWRPSSRPSAGAWGRTSRRCAGRAPHGARSRSPPRAGTRSSARPAGRREDHAGPAAAGDPPPLVLRGGDRGHAILGGGPLDAGCPLVARGRSGRPTTRSRPRGWWAAAACRARAVSLAHHGVLFLDEVCAFAPSVLDALRQPLEEGRIDVTGR